MASEVRTSGGRRITAALVQASWKGDRERMLAHHDQATREAAAQGAQIVCYQELFTAPYIGQVNDPQFYRLAEPIPDGPTTAHVQALAAECGVVIVAPIYEEVQAGVSFNSAVVVERTGEVLGRYRKNHIPNLPGFWEKYYFAPGDLGYPVFDTSAGRVGIYICYERHFPEGWRALGLEGAEVVFNPSATSRGLSRHLWDLEQRAAAVANGYFVGTINRVGVEGLGDNEYYGCSYFADPDGRVVGRYGADGEDDVVVAELDLDMIRRTRETWQFYRDRRPDTYEGLVR